MKRLLVLFLAVGVVFSSLTACEVIGADVAATVEGKDITVSQVQELMASQARQAHKPAPSHAVLDGSAARAALADWIQVVLAGRELAKRHGSVTSQDRQSATQQIANYPGLSTDTKAALTTGIANAVALVRVLTSNEKSPEIKKLATQVFARVPAAQRKQICSEAIAGPPDAQDQVQKLLDAGTELTDPSAFADSGFQAIGNGGKFCINPAQLPTEIQDLYANAKPGVVQHGAFTSQGSDGSSQSGVIFFKVTGTSTLKPDDPQILQSVVQEVQSQPALVLGPLFATATIHVDPRFGSGFNLVAGVAPPASPLIPPTTTKPKSAGSKSALPTGSAPTPSG